MNIYKLYDATYCFDCIHFHQMSSYDELAPTPCTSCQPLYLLTTQAAANYTRKKEVKQCNTCQYVSGDVLYTYCTKP